MWSKGENPLWVKINKIITSIVVKIRSKGALSVSHSFVFAWVARANTSWLRVKKFLMAATVFVFVSILRSGLSSTLFMTNVCGWGSFFSFIWCFPYPWPQWGTLSRWIVIFRLFILRQFVRKLLFNDFLCTLPSVERIWEGAGGTSGNSW